MTCTIDSIKRQRLDQNKMIFAAGLKDANMVSLGEDRYEIRPKKGGVDTFDRVVKATRHLSTVLQKELGPAFEFGWVKRTAPAYGHISIELVVPANFEKAHEVKLGLITLDQANRTLQERDVKFFRGDIALMEQEQQQDEISDEERDMISRGEWAHDPTTDSKKVISDQELYELMNRNNKC